MTALWAKPWLNRERKRRGQEAIASSQACQSLEEIAERKGWNETLSPTIMPNRQNKAI